MNVSLPRLIRAVFTAFFLPVISSCASPGDIKDLRVLASVSSDAEDQDKILNQETRQFEKLRESIVDGKIVSGQTMQKVLDIAGEPVLVMNDGDELKWVYKPGNTGWFSTSKIYFWFDPEQGLVRWECLKVDCARK